MRPWPPLAFQRGRSARRLVAAGAAVALAVGLAASPRAQSAAVPLKAVARSAPTPPWTKGILPISRESYYNAIECGKQGGTDPACVFWDTGLCKNDDFALALYTPYKFVAYQVWQAVRAKQPPPQPSYPDAQRTRVTIGVTPVRGATNPFAGLTLKRAGKAIDPVDRSLNDGGGRYTFDYPALAATAAVSLELAGKTKTYACTIDTTVLRTFR